MRGYQDIRKIGSLSNNHYFISGIFLSGSFSLCGIPFLSGFYSKDAILEQFLIVQNNAWLLASVFVATILTSMYSIRIVSMLFVSYSSRERLRAEADSNNRIRLGVFVLFFPAVVGGLLLTSWNQSGVFVLLPL